MNSQTLETIRTVAPLIPLILRHSLLHILHLSDTAKYLDLQSALIIACLRAILVPSKPHSVSSTQKLTLRDAGIKGHIWVSKYASPKPPETCIRDTFITTLERLSGTICRVPVPDLVDVESEWTGYRGGVARGAALPDVSERERYHSMMRECKRPTTVLYFHGGAYYLCDPATHRATTKKLAELTGGRCYSVRYRLAPQHPFPAALLDALVSYFTLLYPPPDAYHDPVEPEHIVIAGDSAGGNLALSLVQLLLELRRQDVSIVWHGELRQVPLPAGIAVNSPWLDITQSSPTWETATPTPYDYLPKPETVDKLDIPPCDAWPANPPRRNMYIADDLAAHPLASLVMARSWKGAPPVYMCTGWEILAYEDKFLARKLEADGVRVVFEEYEAMPHCFALLLRDIPTTKRCYQGWAAFIRAAVEDPGAVDSRAVIVRARTLDEVPLRFDELSDASEREIQERVLQKAGLEDRFPVAKL
ncbi:AB hydrolase superfamily [Fusarium albosuccineum]|uniref:AB hydrolase superfamily n=1 Tax=Fusarium albosuccineum TaxID=1237068 RepID=A0A8H4P8C5_9HYPO|nr:AB hydrolase superfamily [Fusarium albosuccineum]